MTAGSKRWARRIGFLIGCGVAVGVILSGRMPENGRSLGARVTMEAKPVDELALPSAGRRLVLADRLTPGIPRNGARERLAVRSLATRTLSVRVRAVTSSSELDDLLWVQLDAGGRRVFRGKLQELRRWSRRGFRLGARGGEQIDVRAWLPPSVKRGYQARSVHLALELKPRVVGA